MGNETFKAIGMLMSKELVLNVGKNTYKIDLTAVHDDIKNLVSRVISVIINGEDIILSQDDINSLERIIKAPLVFNHLKELGIDLNCDDRGNIFAGKIEDDITLQPNEIKMIIDNCSNGDISNVQAIRNMVKMKKKLRKQPSYLIAKRLYDFIKCSSLEINEKGNILAYKVIRDDYTDCHTGKMDNSVGKKVTMPRNKVDDDDERTCSSGLHVCSAGYIKHFGGHTTRLVQVEVKPKDFVSIPVDYNDSKARVCEYKVIKEFTTEEALEILNIDLTPEKYHGGDSYSDMTNYDEGEETCDDCGYETYRCYCEETCFDCGEHEDFCSCYGDDDE